MPAKGITDSVSSATWKSLLHQRFKCLVEAPQRLASSTGDSQAARVLYITAWTLHFCGVIIFFVSLCALESRNSSSSTSLLWWTLLFHCASFPFMLLGRAFRAWFDLQPLLSISGMLLMLSCDRAVQLKGAQGNVETAANATLAGAIITLLGYLPLLVGTAPPFGSHREDHHITRSSKAHLSRFHAAGSHLPDLSTMEEGNSGSANDSGMSTFKSYSNPYAVVENTNDVHIEPALGPNSGYPKPPKDLPPSPPLAARVCKAGKSISGSEQGGSIQQMDKATRPATKIPVSQRDAIAASQSAPLTPTQEGDAPAATSLAAQSDPLRPVGDNPSPGEPLPRTVIVDTSGVDTNMGEPALAALKQVPPELHTKLETTTSVPHKQTEVPLSKPEIKAASSLASPRSAVSGVPVYAKLPSVSQGSGVQAAGFLNQGDSEDSDA
eukprot:jgi/Ulvmu1/2634/UM014_0086.1